MCKFLMISRVLYDKGYREYVEAASVIKKKYPSAEFLLLGDIDESYPAHVPKDVIEKDCSLGLIKYLGYCFNVVAVIRDCDCIVHPTFYNEGMSRVLMEALAMGKPIVTTDIPGCRETVDDGVNGYLCKPKDTKSLIEALLKFINLSELIRQQMGSAGRKKAEKQFDVEEVIKVYRSLTDRYLQ